MTIEFPDRTVTYEAFMDDLSSRVAEKMQRNEPEFINQSAAFRQYGRANVERWRRTGRIQPVKHPGTVEYRTADLHRLQNTEQDYLYR